MKSEKFYCRECGSEDTVIDGQNGIKLKDIEGLTCGNCNKKMFKINKECTKK